MVVPIPLHKECPKATPLSRLLEQGKMGLENANFGQETCISSKPLVGSPGLYEPSWGLAFLGSDGDLQAGKRSCAPGAPARAVEPLASEVSTSAGEPVPPGAGST